MKPRNKGRYREPRYVSKSYGNNGLWMVILNPDYDSSVNVSIDRLEHNSSRNQRRGDENNMAS